MRRGGAPSLKPQGKNAIRAGEAMLRAAMEDPEAYPAVFRMLRLKRYAQEHPESAEALRSVWGPLRQVNEGIRAATAKIAEPLRIISAAPSPIRTVMRAICAEYQAQLAAIWADIRQVDRAGFKELLDEIRRAEDRADGQWASQFPCPRPKTAEDWQRLAVRAGLKADFALKGEWTPSDILPIVEGYFERLRDQRLSDADGSAGKGVAAVPQAPTADDGAPFYKPSYFKKYNIGDELLRRNATGGKRPVPGKVRRINKQTRRGKKKFYWYSEPDARRCWPHYFADIKKPPAGS